MLEEDRAYERLVRQAQQADETERGEIMEKLVAQFAEAAFYWALAVLEDENAARDALQEAWLNVFLHLDQLRESAAFPAWLRQIVVTSCYRALRRENPSLPLEEENAAPDLAEEIETKDRRDRVREAVLALPDREREVTELFYFADYPQQEIAEVLSVPLTTVKKRLQYAREHLRGLIQPDIVARLDLYALNGGCTAAAIQYLEDYELIPVGYAQVINEREILCSAGQD